MNSSVRHSRIVVGLVSTLLSTVVVGACTSGGSPTPGSAAASRTPEASDTFAGLPYRLDVPADWVVLGSPAYDPSLDEGADVARWLDALDLEGPEAFRAYGPEAGAAGLRVAINPPSPWRADEQVLFDEGRVAALQGVTGTPVSDMVGVGETAEATRLRWTETSTAAAALRLLAPASATRSWASSARSTSSTATRPRPTGWPRWKP